MHLLQVLTALGFQFSWFLVFCYFGDRMTQRFEAIAHLLYQLQWYHFSADAQRNLPSFIALARKRVFLEGLAGAKCTCEVFKKVGIRLKLDFD